MNNKTSFHPFDQAAPVKYYILTFNGTLLGWSVKKLPGGPYSNSNKRGKTTGCGRQYTITGAKKIASFCDRSKTAELSLETKAMKKKRKTKTQNK